MLALGQAVEGFAEHCKILTAAPRYAEAVTLLAQAERVLSVSYEELLRKAQLMVQTEFKDALRADSSFWQACVAEWDRGYGYKTRVAEHNRLWFDDEARRATEAELLSLIEREWTRALQSMTDLLEPSEP